MEARLHHGLVPTPVLGHVLILVTQVQVVAAARVCGSTMSTPPVVVATPLPGTAIPCLVRGPEGTSQGMDGVDDCLAV